MKSTMINTIKELPELTKFSKLKLKPPIFVVGCPRSGTTLLLKVLGNHPNLFGLWQETFLFLNYKPQGILCIEDFEKKKDFENLTKSILTLLFFGVGAVHSIMHSKAFPLEIKKAFEEIRLLDDYRHAKNKYDLFNLCIQYLTIKDRKIRWVEKTPANIYSLDLVLNKYPDAKIIHVCRDPRAVYSSWENVNGILFDSNIFKFVNHWNDAINYGVEFSPPPSSNYYRLNYESLISSPESELRKLCEFIGEDFNNDMLNIWVYNSHFEDVKNKKGFSDIPVKRWQNKLSSNELIFIDIATRANREKVGYRDSGTKLNFLNFIPFCIFVLLGFIRASHKRSLLSYFVAEYCGKLLKSFS